jgi:hypothetical protein
MHYVETGENKLPKKPNLTELFKQIMGEDTHPEIQDFLSALEPEEGESASAGELFAQLEPAEVN